MTTPLSPGVTPLAHYMPYWWLDNGVLVNIDGSFSVAWAVDAVDGSCLTNSAINNKWAALRRAVNTMPAGYHMQWLRRSRQLDPSFFESFLSLHHSPDPIFREQRALTAESLRAHALRRAETYCVITKPHALGRFGSPAHDPATKLYNVLFHRKDPLSTTLDQHEGARRELLATAQSVAQGLLATGIGLRQLDDHAFLRLIYTFINPRATAENAPSLSDVLPRLLPESLSAIYRDLSLREQVLRTDVAFDLDSISLDDPVRPHRVLALKDLPRGQMNVDLPLGYRRIEVEHWLSLGITAQETAAKEGKIERRKNTAFSKASGRFTRDARASAEFEELQGALDQMARRDQQLFDVSLHVFLGADNIVELDDRTRSTIDALRSACKLPVQTATYFQQQAWLGMLPAGSYLAPHKRLVFTDNVASLIPIYASAPGAKRPIFVLAHRSSEPYSLDIANPKKLNWNVNIFGSSGSGKSFFTSGKIASSILGQGAPLIVIDVGGRDPDGNIIGSYYRLCHLAGGEYFEVSLDGKNAINPFMPVKELYASDRGEPQEKPNPLKLKFLTGLVEMLVRDEGATALTTVELALVQRAILAAYKRYGTERTPLLQDLIPELENLSDADKDDNATGRAYAKTLKAWVVGPYGPLLNSPSRIAPKTPFTVFDMKGIENLGRVAPVMMMILSSYVWNMIARPRRGLAWVIYDECWKLLRDPTAATLLEELYRTARKLDAGVISVTQKISDFLAMPSSQAVLSNADSTFLLRHKDQHDQVANLVGLNPRELALFKSLEFRKGFFSEVLFKPGDDSVDEPAVLRFYPGPLDYWLNTTDPTDRELELDVVRSHRGNRAAALRELAARYPNGALAGGYTRKELVA